MKRIICPAVALGALFACTPVPDWLVVENYRSDEGAVSLPGFDPEDANENIATFMDCPPDDWCSRELLLTVEVEGPGTVAVTRVVQAHMLGPDTSEPRSTRLSMREQDE